MSNATSAGSLAELRERLAAQRGGYEKQVVISSGTCGEACGSLAEAHERGIIHRDIKPSNLFLTNRGGLYDFLKVLDFGLAKQLQMDRDVGITRTGIVVGTPRYIAPEAIYGDAPVDGRADLYNLGGVAYWLLTGQPLFDKSSSVELMIDHVCPDV